MRDADNEEQALKKYKHFMAARKDPPPDFLRLLGELVLRLAASHEFSMEFLAYQFDKSDVRVVRRWVRELAGMDMQAYVNLILINEAERLLCYSHLEIGAICQKLGMSADKLCMHFKERYHCTPTEFRALWCRIVRPDRKLPRGYVYYRVGLN